MKTKVAITIAAFFLTTTMIFAQEKPADHLWTYEGQNKTYELGLMGELSWDFSQLNDDNVGWLGGKAGLVINHRWVVGVAGKALAYDKHLTELTDEGSYRMEAGYSGMFVEYLQPLGKNVKLGFSITSAQGIVMYRYEKEYTEGLPWYEEIIDVETFGVFEPQIDCLVKMKPNWWVSAHISARNTSPVELEMTDEKVFNKINAGISVRYGIF